MQTYRYIQPGSFGRVFSQSFENWDVNILWNVQLSSIYFYYGKENILFKTHQLKRANWKRTPQDLFVPSFAQLSPVCAGLWSSCTYCLWQCSGHCFSLPCQSARRHRKQKTIRGCLGPISKHILCVPSASEHLVNLTCWRIFQIFHTFQEPVPQCSQNANLGC